MVALVLTTGSTAETIEGSVESEWLNLSRSSIVRSVLLGMYVLLQEDHVIHTFRT